MCFSWQSSSRASIISDAIRVNPSYFFLPAAEKSGLMLHFLMSVRSMATCSPSQSSKTLPSSQPKRVPVNLRRPSVAVGESWTQEPGRPRRRGRCRRGRRGSWWRPRPRRRRCRRRGLRPSPRAPRGPAGRCRPLPCDLLLVDIQKGSGAKRSTPLPAFEASFT